MTFMVIGLEHESGSPIGARVVAEYDSLAGAIKGARRSMEERPELVFSVWELAAGPYVLREWEALRDE